MDSSILDFLRWISPFKHRPAVTAGAVSGGKSFEQMKREAADAFARDLDRLKNGEAK